MSPPDFEQGISIYGFYAENGYSRLNFNRLAFRRQLEDMDSKYICTSGHSNAMVWTTRRRYAILIAGYYSMLN